MSSGYKADLVGISQFIFQVDPVGIIQLIISFM